jgi:hypothetical protein
MKKLIFSLQIFTIGALTGIILALYIKSNNKLEAIIIPKGEYKKEAVFELRINPNKGSFDLKQKKPTQITAKLTR